MYFLFYTTQIICYNTYVSRKITYLKSNILIYMLRGGVFICLEHVKYVVKVRFQVTKSATQIDIQEENGMQTYKK